MAEYRLGIRIINTIDERIARCRELGPRGIAKWIAKKFQIYIVISGGMAFIAGLAISSEYWPSAVQITPRNPLVFLNYSSFLTDIKSTGDGEYIRVLKNYGLPVSESTIPTVIIYELTWYSKPIPSLIRPQKRYDRPLDSNTFMNAARLKQVKGWLGYDDEDTRRTGLIEATSYNADYWLKDITGLLFLYMSLPGKIQKFESTRYDRDIFYPLLETLEHSKKAQMYSILHANSTYLSLFSVSNSGRSATSDVKLAVKLTQQELAEQLLVTGNFLKGERIGEVQRLRIPSLQPNEQKVLLTHSTWHPLRSGALYLEERPLVNQVADHIGWILIFPLFVFFF